MTVEQEFATFFSTVKHVTNDIHVSNTPISGPVTGETPGVLCVISGTWL